jgi:hypothetical protein
MKELDTFWIDITLSHESCNPREITESLGLIPFLAAKTGEEVGSMTRKSTVWMTHFREGTGDGEWEMTLEDLLSLINGQKSYLAEFERSGGKVELSINQAVGVQEGVLFKLELDSRVLKICGENGISLKVQAWSAEPK